MTDLDFYVHFNISPLAILSECQYDNICRCGIHYGDDVCEYTDDENHECKNCEKGKPTEPYYPPINEFLLLQLVLLVGIPKRISKDLFQQKEDILNHVISKSINEDIKRDIIDLLVGYLQEYHSA